MDPCASAYLPVSEVIWTSSFSVPVRGRLIASRTPGSSAIFTPAA